MGFTVVTKGGFYREARVKRGGETQGKISITTGILRKRDTTRHKDIRHIPQKSTNSNKKKHTQFQSTPLLSLSLALQTVAREDTRAKFPLNTGATRSSVRPTSLAMSANSLHSLMLLSMCEDAAYENRRLPIIPKPSRKTHTMAAAMAEALSASRGGGGGGGGGEKRETAGGGGGGSNSGRLTDRCRDCKGGL